MKTSFEAANAAADPVTITIVEYSKGWQNNLGCFRGVGARVLLKLGALLRHILRGRRNLKDERPPISWGMVHWKVRHCSTGQDVWTTTLSLSPLQNSKIVENMTWGIAAIW